jgi:hypothetical protein
MHVPSNGSNIPKVSQDIIEFTAYSQVCKLDPLSLTYTQIFWIKLNMLKSCHNKIAMVTLERYQKLQTTQVSYMPWLLIIQEKNYNHRKHIMNPFWHPKIKSANG